MVLKLLWLLRVIWLMARAMLWLTSRILKVLHSLHRWGGFSPGGALGSARFATDWELFWSGARRGSGPIVGRKGRSFLRFNKDGMITVFAPMGAGKCTINTPRTAEPHQFRSTRIDLIRRIKHYCSPTKAHGNR
jgi:type IV secretion system protein VirD4